MIVLGLRQDHTSALQTPSGFDSCAYILQPSFDKSDLLTNDISLVISICTSQYGQLRPFQEGKAENTKANVKRMISYEKT